VEEEFLTVDLLSRAVIPAAAGVIERAKPVLGDRVGAEFTQMQVEVRTLPGTSAAELHTQLVEGRAAVTAAAARTGVGVVASGAAVLGSVAPVTMLDDERYRHGDAVYRGLHDEITVCSAHVHVEMPDRDQAVLVGNHLRPHLPILVALTANSPYWCGRDTGYASWRTISLQRWPVAGPPPYFTSAAHYDQATDTLLASGALVDKATLFWDIRPSHHLPTLEVRAADIPLTATGTALFAALVRALATRALAAVDHGDPGPRVPGELLRAASWRAARDGLDGDTVNPFDGTRIPAIEHLTTLVDDLAPDLGGDSDLVTTWLDELRATGNGATRQRRAGATGDLTAVVDHLLAHSSEATNSGSA
jgi:carboxylate-amine ligase